MRTSRQGGRGMHPREPKLQQRRHSRAFVEDNRWKQPAKRGRVVNVRSSIFWEIQVTIRQQRARSSNSVASVLPAISEAAHVKTSSISLQRCAAKGGNLAYQARQSHRSCVNVYKGKEKDFEGESLTNLSTSRDKFDQARGHLILLTIHAGK